MICSNEYDMSYGADGYEGYDSPSQPRSAATSQASNRRSTSARPLLEGSTTPTPQTYTLSEEREDVALLAGGEAETEEGSPEITATLRTSVSPVATTPLRNPDEEEVVEKLADVDVADKEKEKDKDNSALANLFHEPASEATETTNTRDSTPDTTQVEAVEVLRERLCSVESELAGVKLEVDSLAREKYEVEQAKHAVEQEKLAMAQDNEALQARLGALEEQLQESKRLCATQQAALRRKDKEEAGNIEKGCCIVS